MFSHPIATPLQWAYVSCHRREDEDLLTDGLALLHE